MTYWDNPVAHIRTEFGFDVLQVASGRYAPDRYRSFILHSKESPDLSRLGSAAEDARIKLAACVTDLLGVSSRRMMEQLAQGETDPARLATLAESGISTSTK